MDYGKANAEPKPLPPTLTQAELHAPQHCPTPPPGPPMAPLPPND
ncbi:hypothetical protein A2U01_0003619 [Trifolium medium]|uniref:Uncharacterized protein n=1 Tax=Trifolium medium TaxID=97028 RepID=A0A392M5W0_9FABA|nr:hypothetical protein [Trifolium medium]